MKKVFVLLASIVSALAFPIVASAESFPGKTVYYTVQQVESFPGATKKAPKPADADSCNQESPYYGGVGAVYGSDKVLPVSAKEQIYLSNPALNAVRSVDTASSGGKFFLGRSFGSNYAVEVGYVSGNGSSAQTSVNLQTYAYVGGVLTSVNVPVTVANTVKYSEWSLVFIGQDTFWDYVTLLGKIGVVASKSIQEQQVRVFNPPVLGGYDGSYNASSETTSSKAMLVGAGVKVKVWKGTAVRLDIDKAKSGAVASLSFVSKF